MGQSYRASPEPQEDRVDAGEDATVEEEDTAEDEAGGEEGKEPHPLPQCPLLEADSKEEKTY
jgi:hypothetical protein